MTRLGGLSIRLNGGEGWEDGRKFLDWDTFATNVAKCHLNAPRRAQQPLKDISKTFTASNISTWSSLRMIPHANDHINPCIHRQPRNACAQIQMAPSTSKPAAAVAQNIMGAHG
jgi:hypothetical protein